MQIFPLIQSGYRGYIVPFSGLFASGSELSLAYSITAPWTLSAWVKTTVTGAEELILGATGGEVHINANYTLEAEGASSSAVLRDPAAWMHIHVSNNGAFVNGAEVIAAASITTTDLTNAKLFDDFEGYACEIHLQSGTEAYTSFGVADSNGQWMPKDTTAVAGEHYIKDPSTGVNSGSGSDWTATNVTQSSDSPTDSVSKGAGDHATWNPLHYGSRTSSVTFSTGNQTISNSGASADSMVLATLAMDSDLDIYFEVETASGASLPAYIGICKLTDLSFDKSANPYTNGTLTNYGYRSSSGNLLTDSAGEAGASYGDTWTDGDRIGVRLNAGTLTFYKDGVSQGSAATGLTGLWFPMFIGGGGTWNATGYFADDVITSMPTGAVSLATQNFPAPSISDPETGSFTGNANADGPFVYLGATPDISETSTINSNNITWGTHALPTATGFQVITSSASYNAAGSNTYSIQTSTAVQGDGPAGRRGQGRTEYA